MTMALSSCSVISEEFSCKFSEIDCYRFDYSSIDQFKDSVTDYAKKWSLKDPSNILLKLTINKDLSIESSKDSESLIELHPEDIFVLHTEFPRLLMNLKDDSVEFFEDLSGEKEDDIANEVSKLIEEASLFYDAEMGQYEE